MNAVQFVRKPGKEIGWNKTKNGRSTGASVLHCIN